MNDTELSEGTVIADRYRLEKRVGQGAMGTVWRAEHLSLRVPVAVKAIRSELAESSDSQSRFMREARAAAALRSTHVVQILDHGFHDAVPFIVMEFLEGESLAERIARHDGLSLEATRSIVTQVSRALGLAHQRGIIHRDLKPDNIFMANEGPHEVVKVLDFGIAKDQGASLAATVETQEGTILGTPYYLSPEQAQGSLEVDHRADLWALGVIAFECLTGRRPFESHHVGDLIVRIVSRPIPKPSSVGSVPEGFDDWFGRAVARDKDARFQSSAELASALSALSGAADTLRASSIPPPSIPPSSGQSQTTSPLPPLGQLSHPTLSDSSSRSLPERSDASPSEASLTIAGVPSVGNVQRWAWALGAVTAVATGTWFLLASPDRPRLGQSEQDRSSASTPDRPLADAPEASATEASELDRPESEPLSGSESSDAARAPAAVSSASTKPAGISPRAISSAPVSGLPAAPPLPLAPTGPKPLPAPNSAQGGSISAPDKRPAQPADVAPGIASGGAGQKAATESAEDRPVVDGSLPKTEPSSAPPKPRPDFGF